MLSPRFETLQKRYEILPRLEPLTTEDGESQERIDDAEGLPIDPTSRHTRIANLDDPTH